MVLRNATHSVRTVSLVDRLHARLSDTNKAALKKLIYCLPAPIDGCCVVPVAVAATHAIRTYGATLLQPSHLFDEVSRVMDSLATEAEAIAGRGDWPNELAQPLFRGFRRYPAWALMLQIRTGHVPEDAVVSVGAELAHSLLARKPFTESFAKHVVDALIDVPKHCPDGTTVWCKKAVSVRVAAAALFELGPNPNEDSGKVDGFSLAVTRWFRARREFASDQDHQAVCSLSSQIGQQMGASGEFLRQQVTAGNEDAMQMMLGILAGVTTPMATDLPILGPWTEDLAIGLDLDEGCLKTSVDLFAKGHAKPRPGSGDSLVPANDWFVRPLPHFLWEALVAKRAAQPQGRTCGAILPNASARSRDMMQENRSESVPGIKATVARFSNGLAKFAISLGIGRYLAAVATNDFRVVPGGKAYYAQVSARV